MRIEPILLHYAELILDLLIITILSVLYCPKRKNLGVRVSISALLNVFIIFLCSGIAFYAQNGVWKNSYFYPIFCSLLTMVGPGLFLFICCEGHSSALLFTLLSSRATQNLAGGVYKLLAAWLSLPSEFSFVASFTPQTLFSHFSIIIPFRLITYPLTYLLFFKNFNRARHTQKPNTAAVLISALSVTVFFVFNIVEHDNTVETPLALVYNLSYIICSLLIILLRIGAFEKDASETEMASLRALWAAREQQMALFSENINQINIKYHDLKRSVSLLRADDRSLDGLLGEINESLGIYDSKVETGNSIVDTVLSQYKLIAEQKKIRLSLIADGAAIRFMSPTDTVALLGNILENMIEAVSVLPEEQRTASLSITAQAGIVSIHAENPYRGAVELQDGLPVSSKPDHHFHGFGTKSMKVITDKYRGSLLVDPRENIFIVNILFETPEYP